MSAILEERIELFRYAFQRTANDVFYDEETKTLIHPGEYGSFREMACREFLRLVVPMRLDFGSGFLITDKGSISTQCDIVIYDRNSTPLIQNAEHQRFYPIETVCSIGEVKSNLNKQNFRTAINKLARNKILREEISNPVAIKRGVPGHFDPKNYPYDHLFSFLICNKLDFNIDNLVNDIDTMYEADVMPWQKHNLILSIEDGLLLYSDSNNKSLMYPFFPKEMALRNRMVFPKDNRNCHFLFASSYLFLGTSSASIYYPDMSDYLPLYGVRNQDQNSDNIK